MKPLSRVPGDADLRREGRRVVWLLVAAILVGGLSLWLFGEDAPLSGPGPTGLHFILLPVDVLLLFGLGLALLRYLIRLLSERRAGILGSRVRLKLVATFIGLCLVPAMVLYVAAIMVISVALERTLQPQIETLVEDSRSLTNQFFANAEAEVAREAGSLGTALSRGLLVTPEAAPAMTSSLTDELARRGLSAARVHFRGRTEHLDVSPGEVGWPLETRAATVFEEELSTILAGGVVSRRELADGEHYLVAGVPVLHANHSEPVAALFVVRRLPSDQRDRVARQAEAARKTERFRQEVPWLKAQYALLFLSFSLLIILGATWVGLYIARTIVEPIQLLAEATEELRRGNLEHRVDWQGRDELSMLVGAFNDMASDIRGRALEVQRQADELRGANDELARRREHMEGLLKTMTAGVLAVDAAARIQVANPAAIQVLRLSGDPEGRPLDDVLADETFAELRGAIQSGLSDSAPSLHDMVLLRPRGSVHLQVTLGRLSASEGGPVLLVLLEDVTALVRAQKLATWRQVARRIAHEIKNPLTPIQLSAQRILKKSRTGAKDLPDVLEEGVSTIVAEVNGLKQMVDEFSQFARMPEVQPRPGDLQALLRSVAALYGGHENLDLTLELDDDLPAVAFDAELLRRAVVNLLDNAVEATGGEGPVVVTCGLR
ncbi:MAG: HAMP domain-containing protein, partial [Acidobacteriota bacterium]